MLEFSQYCDHIKQRFELLKDQKSDCDRVVSIIVDALKTGNKIIFCGNGGSAADSQHLAAELMGQFLLDRAPLAALSLTVDTSAITAISNDYGYENVFSRQLSGLGRRGDVLVGMSTSGNSGNVVEAIKMARELGITTIGLTGQSGGKMKTLCDICLCMPSDATNHIQEMHIVVGHWICGAVEERIFKADENAELNSSHLEKQVA